MSLANKFGIPQGLLDAAKAALNESNEYQKKVQAHMAKKGIKSLNDLTGDQKKKFFNDLDAMHTAKHEEVEPVEEASSERTVYQVHKDGKPTGDSFSHRDPEKARKSAHSFVHDNAAIKDTSRYSIVKKSATKVRGGVKINNEEVESVEEAQSHQAKTTMKHISNPTEGEKKAAKKMKSGIPGYRDRIAMLHSAKARGALKKEEVELTQEDLDFIASLNQAEVVEGQLKNFSPHSDLAGRGRLSGYNTTAAGKKREADRETERLKDKMKFTKSQGGIAGPKGKLPEEVELDEEQLDEIKLKTAASAYKKMSAGGNDMKNRTGMAGDQSDRLLAKMKKKWGDEKVNKAIREEEVEIAESITHIVAKSDLQKHKDWMDSEGFDTKTKPLPSSHPKSKTHVGIVAGKDSREHMYHSDGYAKPVKEEVSLEDFTVEEIEEYMQTEEFSQLDELSKDTLASYIKKRSHDVATQGALTRKHAMDAEAKKKEQNYRGSRESDDKANRAFMKGWKHRENIGKAVDRLTKG